MKWNERQRKCFNLYSIDHYYDEGVFEFENFETEARWPILWNEIHEWHNYMLWNSVTGNFVCRTNQCLGLANYEHWRWWKRYGMTARMKWSKHSCTYCETFHTNKATAKTKTNQERVEIFNSTFRLIQIDNPWRLYDVFNLCGKKKSIFCLWT